MTNRSQLAIALAVAALAAAPATAQHVVYTTPVVYHTPVYTYHQPVVVYQTPVVSSGRWFNRPAYGTPTVDSPVIGRSVGLTRLWDPDAGWGGFPFDGRPGLNIAYRLLTR